jgi:Skp family chaperone for outer membrane proteins
VTLPKLSEIDVLNTDIKTVLENDPNYLELIENIDKALDESSMTVVVTESDVSAAANFIANFKKIEKRIESLRKELVQPLVDKKAEVDSFFKEIPSRFNDELRRLNKEVLDFKTKLQEEARKKALEERKRLEEEALQSAIKEGRDEPAIIPEVIPQVKKISEMNASKVHTRRTKTITIVNEALIPREYLMPDEQKIRAERMKYETCNEDGSLVKSTIPGVEFTFNESVV